MPISRLSMPETAGTCIHQKDQNGRSGWIRIHKEEWGKRSVRVYNPQDKGKQITLNRGSVIEYLNAHLGKDEKPLDKGWFNGAFGGTRGSAVIGRYHAHLQKNFPHLDLEQSQDQERVNVPAQPFDDDELNSCVFGFDIIDKEAFIFNSDGVFFDELEHERSQKAVSLDMNLQSQRLSEKLTEHRRLDCQPNSPAPILDFVVTPEEWFDAKIYYSIDGTHCTPRQLADLQNFLRNRGFEIIETGHQCFQVFIQQHRFADVDHTPITPTLQHVHEEWESDRQGLSFNDYLTRTGDPRQKRDYNAIETYLIILDALIQFQLPLRWAPNASFEMERFINPITANRSETLISPLKPLAYVGLDLVLDSINQKEDDQLEIEIQDE